MAYRPIAPPYRRASKIELGGWTSQADGVSLEHALRDWDINTPVRGERLVRVDLPELRSTCGLPDSAALELIVEWSSGGSGLAGLAFRSPLHESDDPVVVGIDLPGSDLGGRLVLRTVVMLAARIPDPAPFTANVPGSILFDESSTFLLQGSAPLFPISVVDFNAMGFGAGSRWRLEVPESLATPTMGGLRLYVNGADEELMRAIETPNGDEFAARALFESLMYDVARTLVELGLRRKEEIDDMEPATTDSFAATLRRLLDLYLPDDSTAAFRAMLEYQPGAVASSVQGQLRQAKG